MARTIFTILTVFSLYFATNASPISTDSACITPTVTTDGNRLIGYVQATAMPGIANIFPLQEFSDHHMIGGNAYHPSVTDRSTVEWGCQYSCGNNCFAFFVYFDSDTTAGKVPHYECRVYAAPFAKSDLVSSVKKEWTKGQAFNKQCYGNAMKFKRVVAADIELGTAGTKGNAAAMTAAGPYPTVVSTKTLPATKTVTVTIKQKSLGTPLKAATAVPTYIAWAETWAKTVPASSESSPNSKPSTTGTTPPSSCSRSAWVTDGATVTGFVPAPAPTMVTTDYDVDPEFSTSHLISQLYLNDKALGAALSKCAKACNAHPQCVAFIVTEGRYPTLTSLKHTLAHSLNYAYHVLWAQVADVRAVTKPDGSVSWTCDLYKHALGAAQMVVAPQNERTIAAFNDMCPAVAA